MLHHIRSVSVHPNAESAAEDAAYVAMSARLQAAVDILRGVRERGERALVFIEHIKMQHRFIVNVLWPPPSAYPFDLRFRA
jgi:hypothetical protein